MKMVKMLQKIDLLILLMFFSMMSCNQDQKKEYWPELTPDANPGTYWWIPGSAWDKENVDWNLTKLKEGGIGTVHIVPIYGAKGYEDRYITYLSDEWLENFEYLLGKADELGMQVDMTTGTGWCFGMPGLEPEYQDTRVSMDEVSGELRFSRGRMVKRAAPGGEGHMLNPLSPTAMKAYLKRFDSALEGSKLLPRSQYHDSYEYQSNWSEDMKAAFIQDHGYDFNDHLNVLFGDDISNETSRRIKYDYRLTAAKLHLEYIKIWADWAKSKGMLTRNQAHGSPSNLLDVYAAVDIPETEMFGSPEFPIPGFRHEEQFCREGDSDPRICRIASSAAHVAHQPGSQLVSSESCTWMREHWHGTLGQIKLEMDLFFLTGINQVFYHGSCYSPKDAPWPGWFFYASTKADWRNSIWYDMPALNEYITRCQSVLQAGQPANDILLYWPIHDLWMEPEGLLKELKVHTIDWMDKRRIGTVSNLLDSNGYAFDFISDDMLNNVQFNQGNLAAPGGTYKAIVVPKCSFLPAETLERLAELAEQGATIIFEEELPTDVPGLGNIDERRTIFTSQKKRLEDIVIIDNVNDGLNKAGVKRETLTDFGLRYIRRKIKNDYWYFIANHTATNYSGWLNLSVPFKTCVLHNPMTGSSEMLPTQNNSEQIYVDIAAGESLIIQASVVKQDAPLYVPMKPTGNAFQLEGNWEVEFIKGGPTLPKAYQIDSLSCWTNAPDKSAQAFAGTARYKLIFGLPNINGEDYLLDLGDVRESARVKVNGVDAAVLFALPYTTRIGHLLKQGTNTIEIEVTNLSANRIRNLDLEKKNWKIMNDINIVTVGYKPFDASGWPLQPSGLLGPVILKEMNQIKIY